MAGSCFKATWVLSGSSPNVWKQPLRTSCELSRPESSHGSALNTRAGPGNIHPCEPDLIRRRGPVPVTWSRYRDAARMLLLGATVPTSMRIAVVVGTWLSLMNQGHPIMDGHPPWAKLALNYVTPFIVSSVGFLAA